MNRLIKMVRRLAVAALLLPAALTSCSDSDDGGVSAEVKIPGNVKNLTFDVAGGEQTIAIQTNVDLVLTPSANWIDVEPLSSTSQSIRRYQVVCQPCVSGEERTCQIAVEAAGFADVLAVKQTAGKVVSIVGDDVLPSAGDGSQLTVTVKANDVPTFKSEASWLSFVGDVRNNGDGTYSVDVKVARNYFSAREGVLTVVNGSSSVILTVKQAAGSGAEISGMPDDPALVPTFMGMGWNLGNSLDSQNNGVSGETLWGNKACTQATMDAIRAAGFRTVRIPVTWLGHIGDAPNYKIEEAWMNRVAEVVGYAENAGLNAIINIHHDGAESNFWLDIKNAAVNNIKNDAVKAQLKAMWTQIANKFKDKGNFLIFEAMNEIHDGKWGYGANTSDGGKQYKTLNEWLQVCVDAIRATGGNNSSRWIGVPGYCTNPQLTIENLVLPTDAAGRLIVAVHFYDPSDYTLEAKCEEWGHNAAQGKKLNYGDEDNVRSVFSSLQQKYVAAGIPVYIGEIGNVHRDNERAEAFRKYYLEYVCKAAKTYGMSPIFWDNGSANTGRESSGLFDHGTGKPINNGAEIAAIMVNAMENNDATYTLESVYNKNIEDYVTAQ